jgi:hypothetical protein
MGAPEAPVSSKYQVKLTDLTEADLPKHVKWKDERSEEEKALTLLLKGAWDEDNCFHLSASKGPGYNSFDDPVVSTVDGLAVSLGNVALRELKPVSTLVKQGLKFGLGGHNHHPVAWFFKCWFKDLTWLSGNLCELLLSRTELESWDGLEDLKKLVRVKLYGGSKLPEKWSPLMKLKLKNPQLLIRFANLDKWTGDQGEVARIFESSTTLFEFQSKLLDAELENYF